MVKRLLDLSKTLGAKNSAFLFGARGVGKTHLSKDFLKGQKNIVKYDLLKFNEYDRYLKNPSLFAKEVEAAIIKNAGPSTVWVDEVQKVPALLDEVHSIIESYKGRVRFLLTGSSARKLKTSGANLLAGRALSLKLHPLTSYEWKGDLDVVLRLGSLPGVVIDQENPELTLKSYVSTYLKEEIQAESIVRRVDAFSRFLEIAAQYHTEPINALEISKAAGVSSPTVKEYFQILEDTLIGWHLPGWSASVKKQLRTAPKFYLFDNGVVNALRGELGIEIRESSSRYGKLFEGWIVQELRRLNDYLQLDFKFSYWQTNSGLEVDIVVSRGAGQPLAGIEIKSSAAPGPDKMKGLVSFSDEHPRAKLYCLCRTERGYQEGRIQVLPWQELKAVLRGL